MSVEIDESARLSGPRTPKTSLYTPARDALVGIVSAERRAFSRQLSGRQELRSVPLSLVLDWAAGLKK